MAHQAKENVRMHLTSLVNYTLLTKASGILCFVPML